MTESNPRSDPRPRHASELRVDPLFLERWSPRAFSTRAVDPETLATVFEAARFAPSCFNDQPWLFVTATRPADLERFRAILAPANRTWADAAPVLAFAFARRTFGHNGKPNRWAPFDTGAAWMSLALAATRLGLQTHAMGGFDAAAALAAAGLDPEGWDAMAAIALGHPGDPASLPADLAARERPSPRKPLSEVVVDAASLPERSRS